jgi:hypothetical protein
MSLNGRLTYTFVCVFLFPVVALSAEPGPQISDVVRDAQLGCRWRRCVTVVPVMPRVEDDREWLRLKFDKGPPYYAEILHEERAVARAVGVDQPINTSVQYTFRCVPQGTNEAGYGLVALQLISAKGKYDWGGKSVEYDNTKPNTVDGISWLTHFLVGIELQFEISASGEIVKIHGTDALVKRFGAMPWPMQYAQHGEAMLKQLVEPIFGWMPDRSVEKGSTWQRPRRSDFGQDFREDRNCIYIGRSEPRHTIRFKSALVFDPDNHPTGVLPPLERAQLRTIRSDGEVIYDASTFKSASAESSVDVRFTQTATIRISDINPLSR